MAASDGAGVSLWRVFPTFGSMRETGPFLLLDEMGPSTFGPREAQGFPDHPHRGFETVTYLLEGLFEHRDSTGGGGVIGPGETQWMTAGSGLVHSEMPAGALFEEGGTLHGFQLWVNLPAAKKMIPPKYQDLKGATLGAATPNPGVTVRVIAGDLAGVQGPGNTHTPIVYAHATIDSKATLDIAWPEGFTSLAYVFAGAPIVMRLLARDLGRVEASPLIRAERFLARFHFWVWGAAIVAIPAYIVYLAVP